MPPVELGSLQKMLESEGWKIVGEEFETLVITEWKETVFDIFFQYTQDRGITR